MSAGKLEYYNLLLRGKIPRLAGEGPLTDDEAMGLALRRAIEGVGHTSPNPPVGAVILDADRKLLAEGFHARAGEPHAEIEALSNFAGARIERGPAGWDLTQIPLEKLQGARMFVTLEPCAHEGRTPSCARTLARLPLKEVVYGTQDPNPKVAGSGAKILHDAGVGARSYSGMPAFRELIEIFAKNITRQKTFVSLKCAASLDGALALTNGRSQWITSEGARSMGHFLRGMHDAIMVGAHTITQDDPQLTVRHDAHPDWKGHLIVIDHEGALFLRPDLKIFAGYPPEKIIVVTKRLFEGARVPFQVLGMDGELFDLHAFLDELWKREIRSLYVEGGGATISEFLRQKAADRLWLFQAPVAMGEGRTWTSTLHLEDMKERIFMRDINRLDLGPDLLTTARISD